MKKIKIAVSLMLLAGSSMVFSSCIGQFALTEKVLSWNQQIGTKFVNELVFLAFWILPVYEVTSAADLLVINSIEFWSGSNPVQAYTKVVKGDNGNYLVKCDGKGYDIINTDNGQKMRLDFDVKSQTWSVIDGDKRVPIMTFIDENHVNMITDDGQMKTVEVSQEGVTAYQWEAIENQAEMMASL